MHNRAFKQRPGAFLAPSASLLPVIMVLLGAVGLAGPLSAQPDRSFSAPVPVNGLERCNPSTIESVFAAEDNTHVIAVRAYAKGARLSSSGDVVAAADLCMVKLLVGPGTPGPKDAPSTQKGIGIEIWLPSQVNWTGRIHNVGGGGFMGISQIASPSEISPGVSGIDAPSVIAARDGAVSAITDTGHSMVDNPTPAPLDGSFLMLPDGGVAYDQWRDFSERGIHEMTLKTKELTVAFYGKPAAHAYFEGCSTGGRQAHKYAQSFPNDYDGIIAGAPAINWTRFITGELYPQLAMRLDLGGPIDMAKLKRASAAAVSACDAMLTGQHDGFISDPTQCRYDPTQDKQLLCRADGGSDSSSTCLSRREAQVINKIWAGQTASGGFMKHGLQPNIVGELGTGQLWFGPPRGAQLSAVALSKDGQAAPFEIAAHMVALEMNRSVIATPDFRNATGNGADGWKALSYADLAKAFERGVQQQAAFSRINTDDPDLSAFSHHGGKLIAFHGLGDQLIPFQGSVHYYRAVLEVQGGVMPTDRFYRLFTVPAMGHCGGIGSEDGIAGVSPKADPPLPVRGQFYKALVDWVEQGEAPEEVIVTNNSHTFSRPLCRLPQMLHYSGGDRSRATSYHCS